MKFKILWIAAAALFLISGISGERAAAAPWAARVDPALLSAAQTGERVEFLVVLADQADLHAAAQLGSKAEKGLFVYETLSAHARTTQAPVIRALASAGAEYRAYWVANFIWASGSRQAIETMAARQDVAFLYANPHVQMDPVAVEAEAMRSAAAVAWNIERIGADDVWLQGVTGQGAVVGGQDTGYDWDHPALKNQYRGWNGASADHNYSWHDAIHTSGSVCGADSSVPCDDHGHGTHTMGTMVGDDGGENQIGVAPGARWIGCRNMENGYGTPTTYSECFQWFIAPTDLNNQNPDPLMAPDVINNSWGCPSIEGCTDINILKTVVENTRAAGIAVVTSAGNSGYLGCGSVSTPPAIYEAAFSVGNTTQTDGINSGSSRGPVWNGSEYILKPDVSAPGTLIVSAKSGGGYIEMSGTSMAAPHVAGLMALLIDARPEFAGDVDTLQKFISASALGLTSIEDCDPFPGSAVPNAVFGYGRIDARAAYEWVRQPLYLPIIVKP